MLYTVPAKDSPIVSCQFGRGSDHLVPSKGDLRTYRELDESVKLAAANSGKIYAYGIQNL